MTDEYVQEPAEEYGEQVVVEDLRRRPFVMIDYVVLDASPYMGPAPFAVYAHLVRFGGESRIAWPTLPTLEKCTGLSRRVVQKAIKTLEKWGFVARRQMVKKGRYGANKYLLLDLENWTVPDIPEAAPLVDIYRRSKNGLRSNALVNRSIDKIDLFKKKEDARGQWRPASPKTYPLPEDFCQATDSAGNQCRYDNSCQGPHYHQAVGEWEDITEDSYLSYPSPEEGRLSLHSSDSPEHRRQESCEPTVGYAESIRRTLDSEERERQVGDGVANATEELSQGHTSTPATNHESINSSETEQPKRQRIGFGSPSTHTPVANPPETAPLPSSAHPSQYSRPIPEETWEEDQEHLAELHSDALGIDPRDVVDDGMTVEQADKIVRQIREYIDVEARLMQSEVPWLDTLIDCLYHRPEELTPGEMAAEVLEVALRMPRWQNEVDFLRECWKYAECKDLIRDALSPLGLFVASAMMDAIKGTGNGNHA